MATGNDKLTDALIRRQIFLMRFSGNVRDRIVSRLNRAEPELRAALKARIERAARIGFDPGPVTTRRFEKRIAAIEKVVRIQNDPVFKDIKSGMRSELGILAKDEATFMASAISGTMPVIIDSALPSDKILRSVVTARPFQGKILNDWMNQYESNDRRRMMDGIRTGILFDETPTQISRRIFGTRRLGGRDGVREITRRGAQALAQTATNGISNGSKEAFYVANKRFIDKELYVATLDSRTTPICQSLDGDTFEVGIGPRPPLHINCRSVRVPVVDGRDVGTRPANSVIESELSGLKGEARRNKIKTLVGGVPADQSYQVFLKNQSVPFQNEVLGPTRGKLFRQGKVTVDSFVDQKTGRQFTLKELSARENLAIDGV